MKHFNEYDKFGVVILELVEAALLLLSLDLDITFKSPRHDIARRFLNEINEFKPIEEVKAL